MTLLAELRVLHASEATADAERNDFHTILFRVPSDPAVIILGVL